MRLPRTLLQMWRGERWERCAISAGTGKLGHLRGAIRAVDNEIRAIDRMIDALGRRFPGAVPTLQRA